MAPTAPNRSLIRSLAAWVLALVAAIPYLPTLSAEFVYDDQVLLRGARPSIAEVLTGDLFGVDADGHAASGYWRPVTRATYFVESLVWGDRPALFHLDNLLLNVALALLVWTVARRVAALAPFAFPAALLFATHPVRVESLAMVSGRTDPLALLFTLLAVRSLLVGSAPGRSVLWFALALGAKESAAMLAPVVACAALVADGTPVAERRRRFALVLASTLALIAAFFSIKVFALGIVPSAGVYTGEGTLLQRALTFLAVLPRYLGLLAWPHPLSIVHDTALASSVADPRVLLGLGAVAALAIVIRLAWSRSRPIALGTAFLAWTLAPASNLIPITYAFRAIPFPLFERYLFVPSLGFAFVVAAVLARLFRDDALRVATGAAAVVLGFFAFERCRAFQNDAVLFETDAAKTAHPGTLLARAAGAHLERSEAAVALSLYDRAIAADPAAVDPRIEKASMLVGVVQMQRNALANGERAGVTAGADRLRAEIDVNLADAHSMLDAALAIDPNNSRALEVRAAVFALSANLTAAAADFRRALASANRSPTLAQNFRKVASDLREQAHAVAQRGKSALDEAIARYHDALVAVFGADPPSAIPEPLLEIGITLLAERADLLILRGDFAAARAEHERILSIAPRTARSHEALAFIAKQEGDRSGAYSHLQQALQIDADSLYALNECFTMLQEDGRTEEARRFLGRLQDLFARKGTVRVQPPYAPPLPDRAPEAPPAGGK